MPNTLRLKALAAAAAFGLVSGGSAALACSRVTWTGPDQQVITGRSMDWPYGFNSHFYVFPRGERINGAGGLNSLSWTSRYGAVLLGGSTAPGGPVDAVFDGINEKGLAPTCSTWPRTISGWPQQAPAAPGSPSPPGPSICSANTAR